MGELQVNKAAAAVLMAGIAFLGASLLSNALVHPVRLAKSALAIADATSAPAAAPVAADPPVEVELAKADPAKGEAVTKAVGCIACHSFTQGGKAGVGPNLYGVVGGPHGHMVGYAYSSAIKSIPGPWTFAELYQWIKKPSAYAPGTKMSFAGLADPQKRADVIDYLRTLSPSPEPLPAAPAAAPGAPAAATPPAAAAPPAKK